MNVNLNLDDKRIKKIVYQLEDGRVVAYNFKNGEINYIQLVEESNDALTDREMIDKIKDSDFMKDYENSKNKLKNMMSDSEMIDKIRKSEFMDELEAAKRRFKIDKAIADTFPKENPENGNVKPIDRRYSIESANAARKIMKLDEDGTLDKIAANSRSILDEKIKTMVKEDNNDLSYDSNVCADSIRKIENKVLIALRNGNKDELEKLIDDYKFYKDKKEKIDDKLWDETYEKVDEPVKKAEVKYKPIDPDIIRKVQILNLSEPK